MNRIKQCYLYHVIMCFISFYKDKNGIYFGKRTNAMVFWWGVFAFACLGLKMYQMWCSY